jgi:hypothetical protein
MEDLQDFRALQEIQDELVGQNMMKAPADLELAAKSRAKAKKQMQKKKTPSPGGADSPYRVYKSPNGFQVLIGRNHTQNDELSTRIAQGVRMQWSKCNLAFLSNAKRRTFFHSCRKRHLDARKESPWESFGDAYPCRIHSCKGRHSVCCKFVSVLLQGA